MPDPDPDAATPPVPVDWLAIVGLGVLLAAAGLWLRSMAEVDPRAMTELGLLSVLPATFHVAAALLTGGFAVLATRPAGNEPLLAAYVATFAALSHTTSVVVAGALGDSWAWANVGIVDRVQRTGDLPTSVGPRSAPADWPGLHTFTTLLSDVSGIAPATLARWMPLGFTLVALLAVWVLSRAFTSDRRIAWTALWLFVLGTWIGPASFSPRGLGIALGTALLAVALPLDRTGGPDPSLPSNVGPAGGAVGPLGAAVAFVGLVVAAVVVTEPVVPVVLALTFLVAWATRASRTLWLAIGLALVAAAWLVGPAATSISGDAAGWLRPSGSPAQYATTATRALAELDPAAQAVLIAGRFVVLGLVALAAIGLLVRHRRGRPIGLLTGALLAPLVVLLVGTDSESMLRVVPYALPWLALAGAIALSGVTTGRAAGIALRVTVIGALTAGFVLAHSGERGVGFFTAAEVESAAWISSSAPAETLLIEGSFNSPLGGAHVERFTRVSLADEPPAALAMVAADPAGQLERRIVAAGEDGFAAVFVVLTRSQRHGELVAPRLPTGLLDSIETELRATDRFRVVGENADVVVFALAGGGA